MAEMTTEKIANGEGDYTEERHQWLDQLSMEDVLAELQAMRGEGTK